VSGLDLLEAIELENLPQRVLFVSRYELALLLLLLNKLSEFALALFRRSGL
jgi:hypothetical protein